VLVQSEVIFDWNFIYNLKSWVIWVDSGPEVGLSLVKVYKKILFRCPTDKFFDNLCNLLLNLL
jgi:hypothetical protein